MKAIYQSPKKLINFLPTSLHYLMLVLRLIIVELNGSMPEGLKGADCKSAGYAYAGSNPARPMFPRSPVWLSGRAHPW